MQAAIDAILQFVAAHRGFAGLVFFVAMFAETFVGLGYLVPGTAILFGVGVLVVQDAVSFELASATLIAGGVAGDAVSFWLGRRYGARILARRFFVKRAALIEKVRGLTARHATKAVIIARFIGQIRPLVPFLAGAVGMPAGRFMLYNVLGAVVATPLHLIPGMAIGLGLNFTGAMTARGVILLLLLIGAAWLAYGLTRLAVRFLRSRGPALLHGLHEWASRRYDASFRPVRPVARLLLALSDPMRRKTLVLMSLGAAALATLGGIAEVIDESVAPSPLTVANETVFAFFEGLRTAWSDDVMVVLAAFGSSYALLVLIGAVLITLFALRAPRTAVLWALACAFAFVSAEAIRWFGARLGGGVSGNYAFPNGHTALLVIVLGYLTVLAPPPGAKAPWQAAISMVGFVFVSLISIAQLYWGIVYVSDLVGGLLLGVFWLILLLIAGRSRAQPGPRARDWAVSCVALLIIGGTGVLYATAFHSAALDRLRRPSPQMLISAEQWKAGAWRTLPGYRRDFGGEVEEPINVQLAGSAEAIEAALRPAGWVQAPEWNLPAAVLFVTGGEDPAVPTRPVLPRLWNGRPEALQLVRLADGGRQILRLWDLGYRVEPGAVPLYLGTAERELFGKPVLYGLIVLPPRAADFSVMAHAFAKDLGPQAPLGRGAEWRPALSEGRPVEWDGTTVVLDLGS